MKLPPALTPWASSLDIFDDAVAESLAPMAERLALLIGTSPSHVQDNAGDPDGYSDLTNRGVYDRLVSSEWLLADELPDEFDRRAVMREHLFLQFARRQPRSSRVCWVLFDAGPKQLGNPRLAHLAALVALARRARAAGAAFRWGVWQDSERRLHPGLSEEECRHLLQARTVYEASPQDWDAWQEVWRLDAPQEIWSVGDGPIHSERPAGFAWLRISEDDDPAVRELSLELRSQATRRTMRLALPPEHRCVLTLRSPFKVRIDEPPITKPEQVLGPSSPLIFDHRGNRLFARTRDGGVVAYTLDRRERSRRPPLRLPRSGRLAALAVGTDGDFFLLLGRNAAGATLQFIRMSQPTHVREYKGSLPGPEYAIGVQDPLSLCIPYSDDPSQAKICRLTAEGNVELLIPTSTDNTFHVQGMESDIIALHAINSRPVWVSYLAGERACLFRFIGAKTVKKRTVPVPGPVRSVLFGFGANEADPYYGASALQHDGNLVTLVTAQRHATWGQSGVPCGVTCLDESHTPGIVSLEEDRRTLTLSGATWKHTLLHVDRDLVHACTSSTRPQIAMSDIDGRVMIYNVRQRSYDHTFEPEEHK